MEREWQVCRTVKEHTDGKRRWDHAYQLLLRWAAEQQPIELPSQENNHENCSLCPSVDQSSNAKPKH